MKQEVQNYYGKELQTNADLQTNACCIGDTLPKNIREIIKEIEPEVLQKFYGCGSPIPPLLQGLTLLDLGCGSGRDVYIASKLVGKDGHVIGVDMTPEQLEVAEKYKQRQAEKFGFLESNVSFKLGEIEQLASLDIIDSSIDIVISNCVINLSTDKKKVFQEIWRVLREGGELYFSDVFTDSRIPQDIQNDPILYGECLSGALYIQDFRRIMESIGFVDFRIMKKTPITINNPDIEEKLLGRNFYSLTVRAFKLSSLEDRCEDYGQVVTYLGTIESHPNYFDLDDHHRFITGKPHLVCGNTFSMLMETRFAHHFSSTGNRNIHFGLFDCGGGGKIPDEGSVSVSCC